MTISQQENNMCVQTMVYENIWSNYISRLHTTSLQMVVFCKGNLLFQGNQGWWNICNLARNMFGKGTFGGIFRVHLGPNISITHAGGLIWYVLGLVLFVVFCRVKNSVLPLWKVVDITAMSLLCLIYSFKKFQRPSDEKTKTISALSAPQY